MELRWTRVRLGSRQARADTCNICFCFVLQNQVGGGTATHHLLAEPVHVEEDGLQPGVGLEGLQEDALHPALRDGLNVWQVDIKPSQVGHILGGKAQLADKPNGVLLVWSLSRIIQLGFYIQPAIPQLMFVCFTQELAYGVCFFLQETDGFWYFPIP